MLRLPVVRKLGLVALVATILVGGTLFAQLRDLSDENSLPGDRLVIGGPSEPAGRVPAGRVAWHFVARLIFTPTGPELIGYLSFIDGLP